MSLTAGKAIKAVIQNRDIAELLSEDSSIFGIYEPAYKFITDYYQAHSLVPTKEILEDKFGDDLFDEVGEATGATRHYLDELRGDYLREGIQDMLLAVGKNIHNKTPQEILGRMSSRIAELSSKATRIEDVDITDVDLAVKEFAAAREAKDNNSFGIKTGIEVWDEYMPSGLVPGMNTVLIGYSGKAKSWFADLIIANAYLQAKKVLVISLEMSAKQQRERIWAIIGNGQFTMHNLQTGNVFDDEVKRFGNDRLNTGGSIVVTAIDGVTSVTPNIIRAKIERYKPDLVVVDYLQLMDDNQGSRDMTPRMLNLSKEIKRLAVSASVPIITISAVTDDEGKKRNSPPTIAQIAWSKGIEYDADMVVAVHKYDNTDIVELACRKNRNGEMFNIQYNVDLGRGIFEPILGGDDEN